MAIVAIFFLAVSMLALLVQLVTPIIINLAAMAIILLAFTVAVLYFNKKRAKVKLPILAGLNLILHILFVKISVLIFFTITLPHEASGDSPAVVQGIRNILASHGWIAPPKTIPAPAVTGPAIENGTPETLNAPVPGSVQITIEGEESSQQPTAPKSEGTP